MASELTYFHFRDHIDGFFIITMSCLSSYPPFPFKKSGAVTTVLINYTINTIYRPKQYFDRKKNDICEYLTTKTLP